jgi:hypothetical protein
MLKHIVSWKVKDEVNGKRKPEILQLFKQNLEALKTQIPVLLSLEVGINSPQAPANNWDIILIAEFNSFANLDVYQKHPDHLKVVEFVKTVAEARACIDFEF